MARLSRNRSTTREPKAPLDGDRFHPGQCHGPANSPTRRGIRLFAMKPIFMAAKREWREVSGQMG